MTHAKEIKRWADMPDGTGVWANYGSEWHYENTPKWYTKVKYVVDDTWAELRKAQAEGKIIQRDSSFRGDWVDVDEIDENCPLSSYRIRPEGPIYEWQWICRGKSRDYWITALYYRSKDELEQVVNKDSIIEPYEPSKRERKEKL